MENKQLEVNQVQLGPNQILVGGKVITFIRTPTSYYLDMQTKVQGAGGKILLGKYATEVLKRIEENYKVDDFTPAEINTIMDEFENFCNAQRN